jgi:hypothetical protein
MCAPLPESFTLGLVSPAAATPLKPSSERRQCGVVGATKGWPAG